jgi:hypothetical protein
MQKPSLDTITRHNRTKGPNMEISGYLVGIGIGMTLIWLLRQTRNDH